MSPRLPPDASLPHPERFLATDSCVQCGLCLPHCPTYLQSRQEPDSPRGRISLIQALARGAIKADARVIEHLDGCLVCRACEDMCPSRVPYASLIDAVRSELAGNTRPAGPQPLESRVLRQFTRSRKLRRLVYAALRFWQDSGVDRWGTQFADALPAGLGRLHSLMPKLQKTPLIDMDAQTGMDSSFDEDTDKPTVQLFTGCAGEVFDRATLLSAHTVLMYLGYRVVVPEAQTCCGALPLHAGDETSAQALAQTNLAAFTPTLPILSTASGCGATLKDMVSWHGNAAAPLAHATQDICSFLLTADWSGIAWPKTDLRVAVHTPCSLRRVLHADSDVLALLARIPGVNTYEIARNDQCCGAAGRYMLDHPEMADTLVADKVADIARTAPDCVVSTNIGCSLHLQAALRRAGHEVEVVHPVTLIARLLPPLATTNDVA
ncbi:hypothetical protein BJI67_14145 [Acidihalobacter aeolianus]|uniref:Glycolate oxidase iron-sulfur subunit n=1 Tax=Acidihalobacter aeolianus TaxID=2792603 RepID=A0A1D8KAQ0_9GAMM|nr:hypothetical protein BJI67_14145 [Acidihalobacter aeolianus]